VKIRAEFRLFPAVIGIPNELNPKQAPYKCGRNTKIRSDSKPGVMPGGTYCTLCNLSTSRVYKPFGAEEVRVHRVSLLAQPWISADNPNCFSSKQLPEIATGGHFYTIVPLSGQVCQASLNTEWQNIVHTMEHRNGEKQQSEYKGIDGSEHYTLSQNGRNKRYQDDTGKQGSLTAYSTHRAAAGKGCQLEA